MKIIKFNFNASEKDIFWTIIYPIYAVEFMFGESYVDFKYLLEGNFLLNEAQWELILEHWNEKEARKQLVEFKHH
jgi:hypothetical protein